MSSSVTYTYPIGGPEFVEKAYYLTKSIRLNASNPEIVTYLLDSEVEEIRTEYLDFFAEHTTLVTGPRPISEYPISAKLAPFKHAASMSDREYIIHLDSDTLLVNEFAKHDFADCDADVFLKPVDIGNQYWASEDSNEDWKRLYKKMGSEVPDSTVRSTTDGTPTLPYYNAGVVVTRNKDFPGEWLETTRMVWNETKSRYADQVALGLLSNKYRVGELNERNSWVNALYLRCPSDVNVIRYQEYANLIRIFNPEVRESIRKVGLLERINYADLGLYLESLSYMYRIVRDRYMRNILDRMGIYSKVNK